MIKILWPVVHILHEHIVIWNTIWWWWMVCDWHTQSGTHRERLVLQLGGGRWWGWGSEEVATGWSSLAVLYNLWMETNYWPQTAELLCWFQGALTDKYCPDPHVLFPHAVAGCRDSPLSNCSLPAISSGVGVVVVGLVMDVPTEDVVRSDGWEVGILWNEWGMRRLTACG